MQLKTLTAPALASIVSAQNLTSVLTSTPELSNLTALITSSPSLVTALSNATNITILAPSNDAITTFLNSNDGMANANNTAFIATVLDYHILQGTIPASAITATPAFPHSLAGSTGIVNVTGGQVVEAVTAGGDVVFYSGLLQNSTVTTADVQFTGGVLHIIDRVLALPGPVSSTAAFAGLTSIAGALTQAQLVETVDYLRDITVFAPTNEAFEAIGSAVGNLTIQQLQGILEYHVINGTVAYSSLLAPGQTVVPSLAGPNLTITVDNGTVFVNSAKVVVPNVLVANGVVHVIDQVLNPNATAAPPVPTASTQTAAFSGVSSVATAPFTSGLFPATTLDPTATSPSGSGTASPSGSASGTAGAVSTAGAFAPLRTGAVGVAALFAGAGMVLNL